MIEITLPWPDKRLSPNSRCHWREKSKAAAEAKNDGFVSVIEKRLREALNGHQQASYIFYPPDRRHRDIDNIHSSCKNFQDGVCQALNIDDIRIKRTVLEWGDVVKGGKVVLTLEEMGDDIR